MNGSTKPPRLTDVRPEMVLLVASLMGGIALLFVTPPFQAPDEPAHFYRAYAVSEGRLTVSEATGEPGTRLPSSLRRLVDTMLDDIPFHPEHTVSPESWRQAGRLELQPDDREWIRFPTSLQYSPLPYLPPAAGIAVGRRLGASPLALVYAARAANLLVATPLLAFAIRQLPSYRWLATLLALMPMAMFLRASISPDALTTAIGFLLTATIVKLAVGPGHEPRWADFAVLVTTATALSLTKPVYFPLMLAAAMIPLERWPIRRRGPMLVAAVVLAVVAVAAGLMVALPSIQTVSANMDLRIAQIMGHPFRFIGLIVADMVPNAARYGAQFIGRLGWMDTPLPPVLVITYAAALVLFALFDTDPGVRVARWQRLVLTLVVAASVAAVMTALYLLGGQFKGMQGRYFHPIALAAAWLVHSGRWPSLQLPGWARPAAVILLAGASLTVTLVTVYARYYV